MPRKKKPFNPECAKRLEELMNDKGLSQAALARETGLTDQTIYKALKEIQFSPSTAEEITKRFPEINTAWLLGYSDFKYAEDQELDFMQREYIKTMFGEGGSAGTPEEMIPFFSVLEYAGYKARCFDGSVHIMKGHHSASFSPELLATFQHDIKTFIEYRTQKLIEQGW